MTNGERAMVCWAHLQLHTWQCKALHSITYHMKFNLCSMSRHEMIHHTRAMDR